MGALRVMRPPGFHSQALAETAAAAAAAHAENHAPQEQMHAAQAEMHAAQAEMEFQASAAAVGTQASI